MSVYHASKIDKQNKDTLLRYLICKEMHNFRMNFEILDRDRHVLVEWKKVTGHIVFEVNMNFTRKAFWLLDGQRTEDP